MESLRRWIGAGLPDEDDCPSPIDSDSGENVDSSHDGDGPPPVLDLDERRLQMQAYNLWSGLAGTAPLPAIGDFDPEAHPSLAPHALVLDFSRSDSDPHIAFIGPKISAECGIVAADGVLRVSQLPPGSLLHRIVERYFEDGLHHEPLGFEAEFVNQRERSICYRGILLPFASKRGGAQFVLAIISWKELVDEEAMGELLLELSQAIAPESRTAPPLASVALADLGPAETPAIDHDDELALMVVRRDASGAPRVLGEVPRGSRLFERAARRLFG